MEMTKNPIEQQDYLLFLYLTLQNGDLDLHLLDLVLGEDLNTGARL